MDGWHSQCIYVVAVCKTTVMTLTCAKSAVSSFLPLNPSPLPPRGLACLSSICSAMQRRINECASLSELSLSKWGDVRLHDSSETITVMIRSICLFDSRCPRYSLCTKASIIKSGASDWENLSLALTSHTALYLLESRTNSILRFNWKWAGVVSSELWIGVSYSTRYFILNLRRSSVIDNVSW